MYLSLCFSLSSDAGGRGKGINWLRTERTAVRVSAQVVNKSSLAWLLKRLLQSYFPLISTPALAWVNNKSKLKSPWTTKHSGFVALPQGASLVCCFKEIKRVGVVSNIVAFLFALPPVETAQAPQPIFQWSKNSLSPPRASVGRKQVCLTEHSHRGRNISFLRGGHLLFWIISPSITRVAEDAGDGAHQICHTAFAFEHTSCTYYTLFCNRQRCTVQPTMYHVYATVQPCILHNLCVMRVKT